MRVLLVVHGYPPEASGGTEVYTRELARALRRAGDEVAVLARVADPSRPDRVLRREEREGLALFAINNTFRSCRSFEETWRDDAIRSLAAATLEEWRPDVVHVQHLTGLSADLAGETRERGIPSVVTLNDYWLICQRGQLLDLDLQRCDGPHPRGCARCLHTSRRQAERRTRGVAAIFESATHFLAPSKTLRERFLAHGLDPGRVTLHEQGIDPARYGVAEGRPGSRLRVGFVGSLMVSKAPHLLLEAFGRLPEDEARLDVFGGHAAYHGDDRYRGRLEPLLRGPGVRWHGALEHAAIPSALASLDVLVVPSVWLENAPFVIKEAFAAGLPVVASDLGGMAELVTHERDGLLFPAGDAAGLEAALRRLLDEPGLLDRLRSGVPRVPSIDDDAARTRALYERLRS
jgi:glycosyltransferase involved in cell wall biosynthesis